MDALEFDDIKKLCQSGKTYAEISETLKTAYPGENGFSEISVKRYCYKHGISTKLKTEDVENIVLNAVQQVYIIFMTF